MAGNLMAFGDHAADKGRPWRRWVVDGTLAQVTSSNEESCLGVVRLSNAISVCSYSSTSMLLLNLTWA